MQPAGRHFRSDQREPDPVVIRALKSQPMVFSPQVNNQRPNASKLMTISSNKPPPSVYSNNSRFPTPGLFTTKMVAHEPGTGVSAFTVPSTRSSAFNRVNTVQSPVNNRRSITVKEEPFDKGTRMVWHPSSSDQVYRMAQMSSQQNSNGTSSIIQIPPVMSSHPGIYIDHQSLANQFYPYNASQNSNVPIVIGPRDINSGNINYISSAMNQSQPRPSILRKLSRPPDNQRLPNEDIKPSLDNGQSSSYFHGDPSVYSIKDRGANPKNPLKLKAFNTDPYTFVDSPRKKPRKQAVVVHEDMFASNVPQEMKPSIERGNIKSWPNTQTIVKPEDNTEEGSSSYYLPRKRMSLLPGYKPSSMRSHYHFEKLTDIRLKKKKAEHAVKIPDIAHISSHGWRLVHVKGQLDDLSVIQKETKSKLCEYKDYFSNLSSDLEDKCSGESVADLLQNINHCCQSNITQTKQALTAIDKLMNSHKPKILELVKEFKERTTVPAKKTPPYGTPTHKTKDTHPTSSTKKTRKRKT